jgi:hypothetical protein
VETLVVLAAEDVYGEDLSFRAVGTLMEGLARKFRQRFPLLEGVVVRLKENACSWTLVASRPSRDT